MIFHIFTTVLKKEVLDKWGVSPAGFVRKSELGSLTDVDEPRTKEKDHMFLLCARTARVHLKKGRVANEL